MDFDLIRGLMLQQKGAKIPIDSKPISLTIGAAWVCHKLLICQAPRLLAEIVHVCDVKTHRKPIRESILSSKVGTDLIKFRIGAPAISLLVLEVAVIVQLLDLAVQAVISIDELIGSIGVVRF